MPVEDVHCKSCDMVCSKFAKLLVLPEEPLTDSRLAKLCCSASWLGLAALPARGRTQLLDQGLQAGC
jgi:hypothetical protein